MRALGNGNLTHHIPVITATMSSLKPAANNTTYRNIDLQHDAATHSEELLPGYSPHDRLSIKTKRQEIAWNAGLLVVPMLVLTSVLFAFVYGYQVKFEDGPFLNLKGSNSSHADDAYYVDLNSTFLIFLASWMSSLAPMLAGFAITLAAYPIAGRILEDTMMQNRDRLLTPFQVNLTLKLVNGSTWSGLWSMILYRFGWGKRVKGHGAALASFLKVTVVLILLR